MSEKTSAVIADITPTGAVRVSVCLNDGHPEGVGAVLHRYYADQSRVTQLLDLGTLEFIGAHLGVRHNPVEHHNNPLTADMCLAAIRDYGGIVEVHSARWFVDLNAVVQQSRGAMYIYVWNNEAWWVKRNDWWEERNPVFRPGPVLRRGESLSDLYGWRRLGPGGGVPTQTCVAKIVSRFQRILPPRRPE